MRFNFSRVVFGVLSSPWMVVDIISTFFKTMHLQPGLSLYSVDALRRRGLRSWLTIVGIVIGVIAIVLLVALGQGIESAVKNQLSFFGEDVVTIAPAGSAGGGFLGSRGGITENDWLELKKLAFVQYSSPVLQSLASVEYRGDRSQLFIMGFTTEYTKVYASAGFDIENGRMFKEGERGVAVLGYSIANELWGTAKNRKKMRVGDTFIVSNKTYTVIGIMKKSGGGLVSIADSGIYMPYEDARSALPVYSSNTQVSMINLKVKKGFSPTAIDSAIKQVLDLRHRIRNADERDYRVQSSEQVQSILGNITSLLTGFLLLIAGISLLVGSIGVANTMFMSVLERTREIGILKAVGADAPVIQQIFVFESGLIGAVGGVIGVAISYVLAKILEAIASFAGVGLPLEVTPALVIFAVSVSFFTGIIAGYFPARRAARMNAVESLRYE
jgi:putative ABC transport system permease protein